MAPGKEHDKWTELASEHKFRSQNKPDQTRVLMHNTSSDLMNFFQV